jgi:Aspartyl protease
VAAKLIIRNLGEDMLYDLLKKENYRPIALQKTIVGHFEAMVSVNGIDTNFIIDTGAAKTVVDLAFARKYKMCLQESTISAGGLGTSSMVLYTIKSVNMLIGEFLLVIPEMYAMDLRHIKESLKKKGVSKPANGVIGADVLIHHKAIIDYANQLLYLQKQVALNGDD